jgi:hypothetical protein
MQSNRSGNSDREQRGGGEAKKSSEIEEAFEDTTAPLVS